MRTRVYYLRGAGFSFQYTEQKHPGARDWRCVGGDDTPVIWPTAATRDQARACFTNRRSVEAALADLRARGLLS